VLVCYGDTEGREMQHPRWRVSCWWHCGSEGRRQDSSWSATHCN